MRGIHGRRPRCPTPGGRNEAIERYLQAVEIYKDFGDAWNKPGYDLCAIDRREAGCAAFRRALAANPADSNACYNLADTLDGAPAVGRSGGVLAHLPPY
jgi:tetratricopeptide (TPR) repeat protein